MVACLEASGLTAEEPLVAELRLAAWQALEGAAAGGGEPDGQLLALMAQVSVGAAPSRSAFAAA